MLSILKTSAAAMVMAAMLGSTSMAVAQDAPPTEFDQALIQLDPQRPETVAVAREVFERLAAEGDIEALNGLAMVLTISEDEADQQRAERLFEQAAEGGSEVARHNIAVRLLDNDNPADDARAVALLESISSPRVIGMTAWPLAEAYMFGMGVEVDTARGVQHLRRVLEADPRHANANYLMGRAYESGWSIEPDDTLAFRHMKLAADAGIARAQWIVGMMLLDGRGVDADAVRARSYVRRAAEQNQLDGMISMAVMLALGQGGSVDEAEARRWYQRAAEQGSAHALRGWAFMLLSGDGGPADPIRGAAYLDLAAKAGDENAISLWPRVETFAAENRTAIEAVKAAWVREHGTPR